MLTLSSGRQSFCDGISRRNFLQVGGLGLCGMTLADLLHLRGAEKRSPKAIIMICLPGGPSHIDMYDLKPDAPAEIRGEFKPIQTNVPGLEICELFPLQAKIADRLAIVRGLKAAADFQHELHEVYTGFGPAAGRPAFGAVVSRLRSGDPSPLPHYVSLRDSYTGRAVVAAETPTYLGVAHQPFTTSGPGFANLGLHRAIAPDRLADRKALLQTFDGLRRDIETRGELTGRDAFTARALDIISSPETRNAFDISREPEHLRQKYGPAVQVKSSTGSNTDTWNPTQFLQARRLVEAGVPVVTLAAGGWDHHSAVGAPKIFDALRSALPPLDRAVHALVTDLHDRGLGRDVAVVMWGEFGRTPRISERAGRDHWANAGFALFAGGGLRTGQAVGATDARGERAKGVPHTHQNVLATLYHVLGIDPALTLPDHLGRPMHLLEEREPIADLI